MTVTDFKASVGQKHYTALAAIRLIESLQKIALAVAGQHTALAHWSTFGIIAHYERPARQIVAAPYHASKASQS